MVEALTRKMKYWLTSEVRSKLNCSLRQLLLKDLLVCLMTQLGAGKNKFKSDEESIKNAPKSGRPKFASRKEIV